MIFRKIVYTAAAFLLVISPIFAADVSESWNGKETSAENIYSPKIKKADMSFLQPIELCGMAAGAYFSCRSDIMSHCMDTYKIRTDLWSVVSNTGLVALTFFAGTLIGGVASSVAFGPMDTDFEIIKDLNLADETRATMVVTGALFMGAGGYIGYNIGGKSPDKYGEEILIGSIAGAIVGSYLGEQLGNIIFGNPKKIK